NRYSLTYLTGANGALTLNRPSTFSGGFNAQSAQAQTLTVGDPAALGAGLVTLSGGAGTLSIAGTINAIANPVLVNGDFAVSSPSPFGGPVQLQSTGTVTLTNTAAVTISGVVSGTQWTLAGTGGVTFSNANTFTGGLKLTGVQTLTVGN